MQGFLNMAIKNLVGTDEYFAQTNKCDECYNRYPYKLLHCQRQGCRFNHCGYCDICCWEQRRLYGEKYIWLDTKLKKDGRENFIIRACINCFLHDNGDIARGENNQLLFRRIDYKTGKIYYEE